MSTSPAVHQRRSIRLKGYDHAQAGAYFITICTHNRKQLFGEIVRGCPKRRTNFFDVILWGLFMPF
jgi:hypothetical protein